MLFQRTLKRFSGPAWSGIFFTAGVALLEFLVYRSVAFLDRTLSLTPQPTFLGWAGALVTAIILWQGYAVENRNMPPRTGRQLESEFRRDVARATTTLLVAVPLTIVLCVGLIDSEDGGTETAVMYGHLVPGFIWLCYIATRLSELCGTLPRSNFYSERSDSRQWVL